MRLLCVALVFAGALACNGEDPVSPGRDAGPCVDEAVSIDFTMPSAFACMENFTAELQVNNGSCRRLTISQIVFTASVTQGACSPAPRATYDARPTALSSKDERVVLDLEANPFCCLAPGCLDPFVCRERFDVEVETSEGTFTASASADLQLSGCGVVCP